MRTRFFKARLGQKGYALVLVLLFAGAGLLAMVGALNWATTNTTLNYRSNQQYKTIAAAEAATEKVLSRLMSDYKNANELTVYGNLSSYATLIPTAAENSEWANYVFSDAQGNSDRTYVQRIIPSTYASLESQYAGLKGFVSTYRILSNARDSSSRFAMTCAVQQDVQLATVPIFQFAVFYNGDMELNGAATLYVRGRVHGNANLYTGSSAHQYFYEDVTVSGAVIHGPRYGYNTNGTVHYLGPNQYETNVATMTLPIGTNNAAAAVREVIQMPLDGESISSAMGRERYYNKAEMIVLVSNTTVTVGVKSPYSSSYTSIPWAACNYFMSTNAVFRDQREGKDIVTTQIDVGKYSTWAATNTTVSSILGSGIKPNILYVADNRTVTSSKLTGVRLINGQTLPDRGLTVATPNPLYTLGHYNQPTSSHLGTTNTSNTKPASLVCDAYTLLSSTFDDSESDDSYTTRDAADTTVVAAVLTGNVPSGANYSGGVNNLPRLLEAWSGNTFTLNGSLVCLFDSAKATSPFQLPGAYYSAPTRNINFDMNFMTEAGLPPGTPGLRVLLRGKWTTPPAGTTTYAGL
jgi:hypothetical protein